MSAERSSDTLQPHGQQPNLAPPKCPPDGGGGGQTIPLAAALRFMGLGFLLGAILAGALTWLLRRPEPPPIVLHPPPTAAPTPTPLPTATPGPLLVFVSGGVRNPGMYQLPAGARVGDALAKAGGLLANADPALVNQAQIVFDGAQIHVPLPPSPTEADASTTPRSPKRSDSASNLALCPATLTRPFRRGPTNSRHAFRPRQYTSRRPDQRQHRHSRGTHRPARYRPQQSRCHHRRPALRFSRGFGAGPRYRRTHSRDTRTPGKSR